MRLTIPVAFAIFIPLEVIIYFNIPKTNIINLYDLTVIISINKMMPRKV
ncbi:hypothetical protein DCCM_1969 [Desulfocucumis palustris]|uniref:Uncharacterized protein n=1 Tax=Desulfocucumis palustris TaxID=1898651 RepID=A0A2L2XB27_9FIRM|nr:hypothetical protein DCCM_1969 [Desulfocucumis palustris]